MAGSRTGKSAGSAGQWGTLLLTAAAAATLLGFQAFLTCTPRSRSRAQAERPASASADPATARPLVAGGAAAAGAGPGADGAAAGGAAPRAPEAVAPLAAPAGAAPGVAGTSGAAGPIAPGAATIAAGATARADGATPPAGAAAPSSEAAPRPVPPPSPAWLAADEGYRLEQAGDLAGAARALDRALALGYRPQRTALDRAALARRLGDGPTERALLARAAAGAAPDLAAKGRAQLHDAWVEEAWRRRAGGDLAGARDALEAARQVGADPQRVGLELAYLDLAGGSPTAARARLVAAAAGSDPVVAAQARAELAALPRSYKLDFYSELFAWDRTAGADRSSATVPMFRLRALWRPWLEHALDLYAFAQGTREAGPIAVRGGIPVLHADDAMMAGGGVLLRALDGRAGVFAQAGPAVATAPGRAGRTSLDVRGGAFLEASAGRCWPAPADGVRLALDPCAEGYGELTYVSRFHDDVFGLARARGGVTLLVAGPVALGLVSEARAAGSKNRDWYDQLADAGAGLRARLLAPFHLDLSATAVAGRYLGVQARDPAPPRLSYVDVRVQAATFLEF